MRSVLGALAAEMLQYEQVVLLRDEQVSLAPAPNEDSCRLLREGALCLVGRVSFPLDEEIRTPVLPVALDDQIVRALMAFDITRVSIGRHGPQARSQQDEGSSSQLSPLMGWSGRASA